MKDNNSSSEENALGYITVLARICSQINWLMITAFTLLATICLANLLWYFGHTENAVQRKEAYHKHLEVQSKLLNKQNSCCKDTGIKMKDTVLVSFQTLHVHKHRDSLIANATHTHSSNTLCSCKKKSSTSKSKIDTTKLTINGKLQSLDTQNVILETRVINDLKKNELQALKQKQLRNLTANIPFLGLTLPWPEFAFCLCLIACFFVICVIFLITNAKNVLKNFLNNNTSYSNHIYENIYNLFFFIIPGNSTIQSKISSTILLIDFAIATTLIHFVGDCHDFLLMDINQEIKALFFETKEYWLLVKLFIPDIMLIGTIVGLFISRKYLVRETHTIKNILVLVRWGQNAFLPALFNYFKECFPDYDFKLRNSNGEVLNYGYFSVSEREQFFLFLDLLIVPINLESNKDEISEIISICADINFFKSIILHNRYKRPDTTFSYRMIDCPDGKRDTDIKYVYNHEEIESQYHVKISVYMYNFFKLLVSSKSSRHTIELNNKANLIQHNEIDFMDKLNAEIQKLEHKLKKNNDNNKNKTKN